jgi:hypothetical protein
MIAYLLTNIDHQMFYEDLAFTLFKELPSFFHPFLVSFSTRIDQLSMELPCEQLLQEEL